MDHSKKWGTSSTGRGNHHQPSAKLKFIPILCVLCASVVKFPPCTPLLPWQKFRFERKRGRADHSSIITQRRRNDLKAFPEGFLGSFSNRVPDFPNQSLSCLGNPSTDHDPMRIQQPYYVR